MYKLKEVMARNLGKFDEVSVSFDPNINYLVGKNGSQKTSLGLNILWVAMQGAGNKSVSKDMNPLICDRFMIIGPNSKSADAGITLYDTIKNIDIKVTRHITKDGTTLEFDAPDGVALDQYFLNELFNVFLISPKHFLALTPTQQAIELGIDISKEDASIKELKNEYTIINRQIKDIGNLTVIPKCDPVDVSALVEEKTRVINHNTEMNNRKTVFEKSQSKLDDLVKEKEDIEGSLGDIRVIFNTINPICQELEKFKAQGSQPVVSLLLNLWQKAKTQIDEYEIILPGLISRIKKGEEYIASLPASEPLLDITELDNQIASASSINVQASKYQEYCLSVEKRDNLINKLGKNKADQVKMEEARIKKIQSLNLPFQDLSINENGELILQGRYLKEQYWSTGELIKTIPILLISSMKSQGRMPQFPYVFVQDFSLLDPENQQEIIDFFMDNDIQACLEIVGTEPSDKPNSIFLKDLVIIQNN
jgi:hypothetical protein